MLLEHNYLAIVYDLESKSYGTDETANKARGFLSFVKKPKFLFYLHFFQDFVESLKQLSLIFQKKKLLICEVPRLLDEKITNIGVINEIGDGLKRLMKNLTENTNSYKNDVILSLANGRRENLQHKKQVYFDTHTRKFDEIILETEIQLLKRFGDFEAFPLKNLCALFDFKLWLKSFNDDKKWGFDILDEVTTFYKNHKFISEEETRRCIRQWLLFRSRVSIQVERRKSL